MNKDFLHQDFYLKLIYDPVYSGLTVHNPNSVPTSLFLILIDVVFESPNDLYPNLEQMLFGKSSSEIPHLAKT